jgi:N-acetylneuraminic acid mutarotase
VLVAFKELWEERSNMCAVANRQGTSVYLIGGERTNQVSLTTAYRYDLKTNSYTQLAPVPSYVTGASAVLLADGNRILVVGNRTAYQSDSSHFLYDIKNNSWTARPTRPAQFGYGTRSLVDAKGLVHVFGGEQAQNTHQVYDPATQKWTNEAPLPIST